MNTYTFMDSGYWYGNGCSCCDDIYMECWNEVDFKIQHSCHSVDDCLIAALEHCEYLYSEEYSEEGVYDLSYQDLKGLCVNANIDVSFVNEKMEEIDFDSKY